MPARALARPMRLRVNRAAFRQDQSAMLKKAKGRTVLVLTGRKEADEKYVLDKRYFDELVEKLRASIETLEISLDQKLFRQILMTAETLDLDRLHSFEEAFRED